MTPPIRQTRSHLMALFEQQGLNPRSDLGQNFLIDLNLLESVVRQAEVGPNDVVLEVGSGTGGMTTFLAQEAAAVVSVEYDPNMYEFAKAATAPYPNVRLINCDALKNKNNLNPLVTDAIQAGLAVSADRRLKLVANLPYHIGTPIIANLLASDFPWTRMVVTIQYELFDRMNAVPRTHDYGALSVFIQSLAKLKLVHKLGPNAFWPRPKVDSAIVRIDPNPEAASRIEDKSFLQCFLRDVFTQRRKLLRGVLAQQFKPKITKPQLDALLAELNLAGETRAEELEVQQLVELSNRLNRLQQESDG